MSTPGAYNPSRGKEITLTSTANTTNRCAGFRATATTAGFLHVVYRESEDTDVCRIWLEVGSTIEPGNFKQIWIDSGSTLVLNPASTIIAYGV